MSPEKVTQWLIKANHDLKAAELLFFFPKENIYTDIICFHCQQAAEKFLKAFLISAGIDFPKTHDLHYLKQLCAERDSDFSQLDVTKLTVYAVETRYPEEFYDPTKEEADAAFSKAKNIRDFVLSKLKKSESDLTLF